MLNGLMTAGHLIDMIKSKVTEGSHQVPIIEADIIFVPWLGLCVTEPGKVLTQVRIAGDREQTKSGEDVSCKRLKLRVQFKEAFSEQGIKVFPCMFVMDGKNPGEVIQSRGPDVNQWHGLLAHAILCRKLVRGSMHARQFLRHFDAEILCERDTDHDIANIDLM